MNLTPIAFDVKSANISYRAVFEGPQFGLLQSASKIYHTLYTRLGRYGLTLDGLRVQGTANAPAEFVITCSLPSTSAILRIKLEGLEVNAYAVTPDTKLVEVVVEAIEATKEITTPMFRSISVHHVTLELHGVPSGIAANEYLLNFVKIVPWDESRKVGVNLAFTLGPDTQTRRVTSTVVIAQSAVVPAGLYIQVSASYDGRQHLNDVNSAYATLTLDALKRLHLSIEGKPA